MRFFKTLAGSFHSAALYREVRASGFNHLGYALGLVAFGAAIVVVGITVILHTALFSTREGRLPLFDDVATQIASQLPVMTLNNNTLMTKDPQATIINVDFAIEGEANKPFPLITIDTTGATTHDTMKTPVLVTDKDIIIKTDNKTEIKSLSEFTKDITSPLVINRALAEDMAKRLISYVHDHLFMFYLIFCLVGWGFFTVFMAIMRISMLLVLGLVGLIISALLKSPISYTSAFALAAVSYTPVAVLDLVLFAAIGYPASGSTLLLAGAVALFAAMRVSTTPSDKVMIG